MDDLIGRSLNRYTILELIGKGGAGAVYRAHDTVLQRDVAIKVMHPELANRENFRERFLQEARTAARLDHPGIVKVHDFGQEDTLLFIVMEYIAGSNLRNMLQNLRAQNKWILLNEAVGIVHHVAQALDYVHSQGVIHRDIKPDNLMVKPEPGNGLPYRVVITDLGVAKLVEEEVPEDGSVSIGTPGYMSPEQALGRQTSPASEVYSLGILLYELAVGRLPFPAKTISEAVRYHTEAPIPAPRSIRPDLPEELERVILHALEKDPTRRYSNPGELAQAIETAVPTIIESGYLPENIEDTVSLITQYELETAGYTVQGPQDGFPRSVAPGTAVGRRQDFIQVLLPDRTVRMIEITADEMVIGRDPASEIVLDHPKVSRQHARLQYDGRQYWISDLNSRNGTFLANRRLVAGDPVVWETDQAVQIGEIWLRLKRSNQVYMAASHIGETQAADTMVENNIIPSGASAARVGVFMETVHLSVSPGSSTVARFVVLNRGPVMDQFQINIEGVPVTWLTPPPVLQLPPGGQQEVRLNIQPPQSPHSRPGRYPITITAHSQEDPVSRAEVKATLTVGVYSRFTSDLRPRHVPSDQTTMVTIQNQGNAQDTFAIEMMDQTDELLFHPPQARLTLAEGEMASTEFLVATRRRRWIGGPRSSPFTARVSTSSGEVRTHTGEVASNGIFPPILLPLVLVLCLCVSALAAYGYFDMVNAPARAAQTAAAETQVAAATHAALAMGNQATLEAATATAQAAFALTLTAFPTPVEVTPTDPFLDPTPTVTPITIIVTPTPEPPTPTLQPTQTPIIIIVTPTLPPPTPIPPTPVPPTPTMPPPPTPTSPQPQPTPLGGSLLVEFTSGRDGQYEIYAMLSDGSRQTRVTNNPANDTDPSLAPDFSRVVFVSDRDGRRQIYIMNADGSGQARLSNSDFEDYSPAWSPDGSRVAFTSTRDGNPEIYVMNIDGSNPTRLTNNPADEDNPAWSPAGNRIIFDSGGETTRAIYIMDANGANPTPLTDGTTLDFAPSISPDGAQIAFVSNRDGVFDIYRMNIDGSGVTRVTNIPENVANPSWSRDGQWIAFNTRQPAQGNVFIVRVDGSQLTNLTNNQADDFSPTW